METSKEAAPADPGAAVVSTEETPPPPTPPPPSNDVAASDVSDTPLSNDENTSESQHVEADDAVATTAIDATAEPETEAAEPVVANDDAAADDEGDDAFKDALDSVPASTDEAKADDVDAEAKETTDEPMDAEETAEDSETAAQKDDAIDEAPEKPDEAETATETETETTAAAAADADADAGEQMEVDAAAVDTSTAEKTSEAGDQEQECDRPEEVDMDNVNEHVDKDKSVTEDPFDQLKQNVSVRDDTLNESTMANNDDSVADEADGDDADADADADSPDATLNQDDADSPDATLNHSDHEHENDEAEGEGAHETSEAGGDDGAQAENEGMDDLEHGKGIDEAISLLPDDEREISDADKQRAIQAEEVEKDTAEAPEAEAAVDTNATDTESTATATETTDAAVGDDAATTSAEAPVADADTPGENEIRELAAPTADEQKCDQCAETKQCRFNFMHESERRYLCTSACVATFRESHTDHTLTVQRQTITLVADSEQQCTTCDERKPCKYRLVVADPSSSDADAATAAVTFQFWCDDACLDRHLAAHPEAFTVRRSRHTIDEICETAEPHHCIQCSEDKPCRYSFVQPGDEQTLHVCHDDCLNLLLHEQPDRFIVQRRKVRVRDLPKRAGHGSATISTEADTSVPEPVKMVARTELEAAAASTDRKASFVRHCGQCYLEIEPSDRMLQWETIDFCNETCLGQYQNVVGGHCTTCRNTVSVASLGKYCVRFGFEIRQFCRSGCLDEFKKGLKLCSFCQTDISQGDRGFLASVGGQFKDFCQQSCMRRYDEMCNPKRKLQSGLCAVCNNADVVQVEVNVAGQTHKFCSNPCFSAFQFVNNINADKCQMCAKYFERKSAESFTIYPPGLGSQPLMYCSKVCMNIYIITHRKIVPCQWCKVKKYNFDMVQKSSGTAPAVGATSAVMLCSLNCLTLCEVSMNAITMRKQPCDQCSSLAMPQYHLTMSDSSIRNFCTYQCVMSFQSQFSRTPLTLEGETAQQARGNANAPVPAGLPKRVKNKQAAAAQQQQKSTTPMSSNKATLQQLKQLPASLRITAVPAKGKVTAKPTQRLLAPKVPIISSVQSLASGMRTRKGALNNSNMNPVVSLEPLTPLLVASATSPAPAVSTRKTYTRKNASIGSSTASAPHSPPPRPRTPPPPRARTPPPPPPPVIKTQIVTIPPVPKKVANMSTSCRPAQRTREVQCRPNTATIGCQTDAMLEKRIFIPIPVPIYIPQPMHMYSLPTPIPVPIPLPIPVPVFIPTTRNSSSGILKEIRKIQDKMPTDPFEAELLMMAEMVAGDKKKNDSDSGSDDDADDVYGTPQTTSVVNSSVGGGGAQNQSMNDGVALGDDVLQMALKMAQDYEVPAVDLESAMTANTITPGVHPHLQFEGNLNDPTALQHHHMMVMEHQRLAAAATAAANAAAAPPTRGRKRGGAAAGRNARGQTNVQQQQQLQQQQQVQALATPPAKRVRRLDGGAMITPVQHHQQQPEVPREPAEKADANMCLKFTFGVNAWKQWVMTKNADLEKSSIRRKPINSELLQLTADELNYSLCLFVKEVRKPNGSEYAPDTIYYLVLGIQQYLYENGRIDNIFTDPYYEKFTDCLDDVAKKFSVLYNDSQYIVTRVEEEHLWECKQLGAHSPHVLLSTLMFFNTKHFNLTTVEEHMQLSFSHIMKHWKRNPNQVGAVKTPGSRNVLLRFYPPQAALDGNSRKKKVYEQQENEDNPLRCPVKLYEFYLSKCPESVKTRNDVFYLQPERSCVPDSPVWYSTQALGKDSLCKMLHRVKMVKEINIALLTS